MFLFNFIKKWLEKRKEQRITNECQRLFERNAGLLLTRDTHGLRSDKNAVQALTTQLAFYARHPYHEVAKRKFKEIADSVHKISNTGGALSIWSSFYTNALNAKPRTLLENTHVAYTFNESFQHFFADHIQKHPHTLCSFLAKGHHEPLIQDKETKEIICRSLQDLCSGQKNKLGSDRARFAVLDFLYTHYSSGTNDSVLLSLCAMLKGKDGQRKPKGLEDAQIVRLNEIYCDFVVGKKNDISVEISPETKRIIDSVAHGAQVYTSLAGLWLNGGKENLSQNSGDSGRSSSGPEEPKP